MLPTGSNAAPREAGPRPGDALPTAPRSRLLRGECGAAGGGGGAPAGSCGCCGDGPLALAGVGRTGPAVLLRPSSTPTLDLVAEYVPSRGRRSRITVTTSEPRAFSILFGEDTTDLLGRYVGAARGWNIGRSEAA